MTDEEDPCPFLVPVVADRLWMNPVSVYCRLGDRVRVPAPDTLARTCAGPAHRDCPQYRAAGAPSARDLR